MIPRWLGALARHADGFVPSVLVTITEVRGSAPRDGGTKMVFTADRQDDTVGGGSLEYECGRIAREMLRDGVARPATRNFPLGPALGQCCGGNVTVLFEPMLPTAWSVVVFGAGHVGQAVIKLLAALPCRVTWVDSRAQLFDTAVPSNVVCVDGEAESAAIPPGAMILVMSHDHQLDYRLVRRCLERGDLRFIGLIGSDTKRARFMSRLAKEGHSEASLARLTCPIGLPDIASKLPAEIAVSVVAQLLSLRDAQPRDVVPTLGDADRRDAALSIRECLGCKLDVGNAGS